MPISEQEGAGDFISIKQIWLRQIDRCNELLSNYTLKGSDNESGYNAAIASVNVLIINLVDYGDAPIKTEYNVWEKTWYKEHESELDNISALTFARKKFGTVIKILNKYQMLHDALPRGYTNVVMEGVKEVDENGK